VELHDYVAVLRRRWLTVVLTALLFMVLAGVVAASRAPVYETSIDFYVLGRSADGTLDYTAGLLAEDRARTYARLIGTRRVAEAIVADLRLSADPAAVSAQLDGRATPDSVLVVATVRDSTPERAQAIAHSLGEVLPMLVQQLEDSGQGGTSSISIVPLGSAPFPTSAANASFSALLVIGATVGLVAGLAAALVRDRLDPIVRRLDDLAQMPASVISILEVQKRPGPDGDSSGRDERFGLVRLSLERMGVDT
jgi:succinoglycan biosynthesis transport protein ExoP